MIASQRAQIISLRLIWSGVASVGIAGFLVVGGLLLYDATTYSDRHIDR